jgi:hypothetical protein
VVPCEGADDVADVEGTGLVRFSHDSSSDQQIEGVDRREGDAGAHGEGTATTSSSSGSVSAPSNCAA